MKTSFCDKVWLGSGLKSQDDSETVSQYRQCTNNGTLRRVSATIVVVEKQ
jgi:hypothetical protein